MTGWPFATCMTFGPYGAFACGIFSEDHALEAWERMTTGGVGTKPHHSWDMPYVQTIFKSGHVHTEYLAYAAR